MRSPWQPVCVYSYHGDHFKCAVAMVSSLHVQLCGVQYIHIAMQPLPPSIPATFLSSQTENPHLLNPNHSASLQVLSICLKVKVLVTQSCLSLCSPVDCSPPGSSVQGILQARILEWLLFPSSGHLPDPGIKPVSSMLAGGFFTF